MDYEERIDNVDRSDIWKAKAEEWLESFKSEETPIEERITDYRINGWSEQYNTDERIKVTFHFEVTPVDSNNTKWDTPQRNNGYLDMQNVDGVFQTEYLSNIPKNYDKFLEEFEEWKKENSEVETVAVQGQKEEINAKNEIDKMSNGIVAICTVILVILGAIVVTKLLKKKLNK